VQGTGCRHGDTRGELATTCGSEGSIDAIESLARRVRTDSMTGTERFNHVKAPVAGAG
jgi:hypothetical protein